MTPKLREASRPSVVRTFLIADIRGYTRFTNELGDEAGSRLAAKFAQISFECVEAHGGVVLELRGDEAMCVFDSARAALRCAVELQDAFADETRLEPHLPLRVGVGLDAGEAVPVGDGYRGSAINLAARLCSAAEAGDVIATEGLVHLAGRLDGLSYVGLDGRPLKGFDEPVPAWLVSAERPHEHMEDPAVREPREPDPIPPELDAIVPLVGREADLRWLAWYWRRARHGHGGAVAISGPPGIGRTRLAAEVAALAHGQGATARYVRGDQELDLPAGPALVVVDDLERIPSTRARGLLAHLASEWAHRLVILAHADSASSPVRRQLERIVPGERRRVLGPLDATAVNQIARLYLEQSEDDPPTQLLLEESGGIPAAIHRVASQWARAAAARRLGASARRTSRERRDLRVAEAAMIEDVATLGLARERSRLFVAVEDASAEEPAVVPSIVCPYKGLAAFDAADTDYYFGRERLIAELIARMVGSTFVGLIGASGSGKSSALQAGLLPALGGGVLPSSEQWIQVPMRPADHPMRQLRAALARSLPHDHPGRPGDPRAAIDAALAAMAPAQRLLLVIDQFEELFTSATDEAERSDFIDVITEARPGLKVLVALRADHYERCAAYPRLARLVGADQVLVGPLTTDEIAAIIRHPAERVGLRVEGELVEALVADVGTEPGGLPLLSTALLELWEARDGGRLTLAAYRATGGVHGAVARLAEAAYAQLDETQQAVARAIFLRLAGEGDGGSIVRRRVTSEELDVDESPDVAAVTAELTAARLLTASDGYVEVAHEALLREWPRLHGWIDEDSSGRQLRLHLMSAARAWDEGGREAGDLYRGARIAAVLEWSAEHGGELNAVERAFIDESRAAAEREAERQRRTNRRLRGFLVGTAALLVVAVVAGLAAMTQAGLAEQQRERAEENAILAAEEADRADEAARVSRARELWASSIAVLDRDPELTLLLAMEASKHGVAPPPEAVTALHAAIQRSRSIFSARLPSPDIPPIRPGVEISPDGERVWATAGDGRIFEYSVADGTIVREFSFPFTPSVPGYPSLAASPDGGRLAHVDPDAVVHVYDLETGAESTLQAPGYHPDSVVWSPDGGAVATITYDDPNPPGGMALVSVMDLTSGEVRQQWPFEFMWSISFAPEGDRLFGTACPCNAQEAVFIMDLESGDVSVQVGSEEAIVQTSPTAARFSPDGTTLATAGQDRRVNLWDTETGTPVTTLAGHTQPATDIVFSPDGTLLATTSRDGSTKVWDIARAEMILDLVGQGGIPAQPSFSDDGSRLATTSSDLSLRVWDLSALRASEGAGTALGEEFLQVRDLTVEAGVAAVLGRGCRVGFCPGTLGVTAPGSDRTVSIPDQLGAVIALSPDGSLVVSQADARAEQFGGPIYVYDAVTGEIIATLEDICPSAERVGCIDPPAQLQAAAFDRTGDRVALGGFNFVGEEDAVPWWGIWSIDGRLEHLELDVRTFVAFDPRGDYIAVSDFSTVGIRSAEDPATTLATIPVTDVTDLEFSPDGRLLALASPDNLTRLYETEGWTLAAPEVSIFAEHLSFSDDGERLLLSDAAGFVRIWDVSGQALLYTVPVLKAGPGVTVSRAYFLSDAEIVLADSRTLITLVLDPEALLRLAAERTSRSFTPEECQTYLHADECPDES